ncbi:hypothetical protein DJ55_4108 [Yersinia pseudotuberculosis]|nr:hypothetical protein DJ55_4108 [Yersinia pseudotuberculosis]
MGRQKSKASAPGIAWLKPPGKGLGLLTIYRRSQPWGLGQSSETVTISV